MPEIIQSYSSIEIPCFQQLFLKVRIFLQTIHFQGFLPGVQHLLHLKSKSKILRPIEIMGFFYEFFCQIQGNNLL